MKTTFHFGIIILLLTIITLPSCNHEDDLNEIRENCTEMAPGDICLVDEEFSIRFVSVFEDSRCPTNVLCAWEGQAEIELEYLFNDIVVKKDTVNVRPGNPEAGVAQFEKYHIEAVKLDPYPEDTDPIVQDDYSLTLNVSDEWFQANITGFNPTLCPTLCCGGYYIEIDGKTYTNYNYFELSGEDPATANFPIPIEFRYEYDIFFPCHVRITEVK